MITTLIDSAQVLRLKAELEGNAKKLKKELAIAVNATANLTKSSMAKQVSKELATSQKNIKSTIGISKKATKADTSPSATVVLKKTRRLSLREFGARQNKRGVSYKVSKTSGRKFIDGAFQGPKPGVIKSSWRGHVFKREGKSRLPIIKLMGPSPWGVFVKKELKQPTKQESLVELRKQIDRRLRYIKLKKSGAI